MKTGGVYIVRTRKPNAWFGLPVVGRHTAYVGQTGCFKRRIGEHLVGSTRYAAVVAPKPWSDLAPRVYRIGLPDSVIIRRIFESVLIFVLMPVYNVQGNRHNPRRIMPHVARAARARRDRRNKS